MFTKIFQAKHMSNNQLSKTTSGICGKHYGINLFNFFNSYTKDVILYVLKVFWSRYQCGYGPKDYRKNSTHIWSIKRRCLTSFSIKHLYTWLDVAEIMIYHKAHTWTNGSFAHGEHDSKSISCMSHYAPHMS
jgi:hypothetical protein